MPSQSAATLRSRYAEQAASDLEQNRRRQQELTERIRVLKQEEALLQDILAVAERFGADGAPPSAHVPEQTRPTRRAPAVRAAAAAGPERTLKTRPKTAAKARKGKPRPALLGDLLTDLLAAHEEPCPAKELREELLRAHPDRQPTPQVVRNTLEALVAKSRVRRHKSERSVSYTLVRPERPAAEPVGGPATESAGHDV
ncbi:hypothetical protein [Streptomyces anandii]|uniref:hypothetical protein n=1 Tax=Streptomyces anandii TaxID=285454 RepID=UPI001675D850|nr:hypothetical protein [Streptomyces anandii]GGX97469.1 hypothetical protein GCM10010510_48560 [Streptomyces anandii JCM 4720]